MITDELVICLVDGADEGSADRQPDDVQSAGDSVQKLSNRQLLFSDNFEGTSGLR